MVLPSNRKFGYFFSIVFFIAAAYFYLTDRFNAVYLFILLSSIFFAITVIKPNILFPLNKLWMLLGLLLGLIFGPIVLGIIFFGLITPIGIIFRIFGRDELRLQPSKRISHWVLTKTEPVRPNSFKNQF